MFGSGTYYTGVSALSTRWRLKGFNSRQTPASHLAMTMSWNRNFETVSLSKGLLIFRFTPRNILEINMRYLQCFILKGKRMNELNEQNGVMGVSSSQKVIFENKNILCIFFNTQYWETYILLRKYPIICLIRNETIHIHIWDSEPGVMAPNGEPQPEPDVQRLETFMCSPPGPRTHFRRRSGFILLLFLYECECTLCLRQ